MQRAITDGVDRAPEASTPTWPDGVEAFAIIDDSATAPAPVGLLGVAHDVPTPGDAAVVVLAITRAARGRAAGMRALLVAAARLDRASAHEVWACVPRTNGHGLYFMLRAGFAPVSAATTPAGNRYPEATWFRRIVKGAGGPRRRRAGAAIDGSRPSSGGLARGTTAPPEPLPPVRTRGRAAGR